MATDNKTAIQVLFNELVSLGFIEDQTDELLQSRLKEAKEIEKQQITEAYRSGVADEREDTEDANTLRLLGKYYAETYGGDNE